MVSACCTSTGVPGRDLIAQYGELQPEEAWSATPGLDIRSMQHERLYSRLYRS